MLVSDNYRMVPDRKGLVHAVRAAAITDDVMVRAAAFNDITDAACPEAALINANSGLLYNVIVYLLNRVAADMPADTPYSMYATCPSQKLPIADDWCIIGGVPHAPGANVQLCGITAVLPPSFVDGEGETVAWLWAAWFARVRPDTHIFIRSIDTDNIGIAFLMDPAVCDRVTVELKPVTLPGTKYKQRRTFHCAALKRHEPDVLRDMLLIYILGGGSDYCRGASTAAPIPGCGIRTLLKHRMPFHAPLCCSDQTTMATVLAPATTTFLTGFHTKAEVTALAPVIADAVWNMNYWGALLRRNAHVLLVGATPVVC